MADEKQYTGAKPKFVNGILTPTGGVRHAHLVTADIGKKYSDGKFKLTLIWPKQGTDLSTLKAGVLACAKEAFGPGYEKLSSFAHPFKDGDLENIKGEERWPGCWYAIIKSKNRPVLLDRNKSALVGEDVYNGCEARCIVAAMSYTGSEKVRDSATGEVETVETKGVTLLLEKVQKMAEGERLAGARAEVDFPDDAGAAKDEEPPF
jgi:hypothetical protein